MKRWIVTGTLTAGAMAAGSTKVAGSRDSRKRGRVLPLVAVLVGGLLGLSAPRSVQAASFDCAKAATAVEKTICGDAELSKLDEDLAGAYTDALDRAAEPDAVKTVQRTWLRNTRDACADAACLKAAYQARIEELAVVGESELPLGPAILKPPARSYRGFEIVKGGDEPVCQGIAQGLREQGLIPSQWAYCGVPFPAGSTEFQQISGWRDLDPAANMELVREIFYWFNAQKDVLGAENAQRQLSSRLIIPEISDLVWEPSKSRVRAAIAAGQIQLQVARFDLDNTGELDTVYRMTAVRAGVHYDNKNGDFRINPPAFEGRQCWHTAPGWPDSKPYAYFVDNGMTKQILPSRAFPLSNLSLFRFDSHTYFSLDGWQGQVRQPFAVEGHGPVHNRIVCGFRPF